MASCRCIHMEHANEPCCRAGWSNHVLRMFRTERRSRCHLVPRQAPRCCKAFLAQQGYYVGGGDGSSHARPGKARTCSQLIKVLPQPKVAARSSAQQLGKHDGTRTFSPPSIITPMQLSRCLKTLTRKASRHHVLDNTSP